MNKLKLSTLRMKITSSIFWGINVGLSIGLNIKNSDKTLTSLGTTGILIIILISSYFEVSSELKKLKGKG